MMGGGITAVKAGESTALTARPSKTLPAPPLALTRKESRSCAADCHNPVCSTLARVDVWCDRPSREQKKRSEGLEEMACVPRHAAGCHRPSEIRTMCCREPVSTKDGGEAHATVETRERDWLGLAWLGGRRDCGRNRGAEL